MVRPVRFFDRDLRLVILTTTKKNIKKGYKMSFFKKERGLLVRERYEKERKGEREV
jgi:hypothetical protein